MLLNLDDIRDIRKRAKTTDRNSPGFHKYKQIMKCPKKAFYKPDYGDGKRLMTKNGLDIGTMGHAVLADYYQYPDESLFNIIAAEPWSTEHEPCQTTQGALDEVSRLCEYYVDNHPRSEFRDVIDVEQRYLMPDDLSEYIGTDLPYAFTMDMLATVNGEVFEECRSVDDLISVNVQDGAAYIVDHKFIGQLKNNLVEEYTNSLQFVLYYQAASALYPEVEIQGTIVNIIIKRKNPVTLTIVLDPPGDQELARLERFWRNVEWTLERVEKEGPFPIIGDCFLFRTCNVFDAGQCDL